MENFSSKIRNRTRIPAFSISKNILLEVLVRTNRQK